MFLNSKKGSQQQTQSTQHRQQVAQHHQTQISHQMQAAGTAVHIKTEPGLSNHQSSNFQVQSQRNFQVQSNVRSNQSQGHQLGSNHQSGVNQGQQPRQYFNVQRSPKIDEAKIQEIKKELQSPPQMTSHAPQPSSHPVHQPVHNQGQMRTTNARPSFVHQTRPSIIRRTDSPTLHQPKPIPIKQEYTPAPKGPGPSSGGPAFGSSQLRVAPGAGPLPGLKTEPVPRIGTLREEQQRRLQMQQQNQQNHHRPVYYQSYRPGGQPQGLQVVQPRNTPIPRNDSFADHRLTIGSANRKPWDLDLQPRRQNGIEVVSRPRQDGIEVIGRPRGQLMQQGQVLPSNAQLRPGFQIYNGQLIEVRPTNNFQMAQSGNSQSVQYQSHGHQNAIRHGHSHHQSHHQMVPKQENIHKQPANQRSSNQSFKRPGYDASSFEVLKRDALKDIKKEMTEKLLLKKQKPPKATKLIWDPISKFFKNDPLFI